MYIIEKIKDKFSLQLHHQNSPNAEIYCLFLQKISSKRFLDHLMADFIFASVKEFIFVSDKLKTYKSYGIPKDIHSNLMA